MKMLYALLVVGLAVGSPAFALEMYQPVKSRGHSVNNPSDRVVVEHVTLLSAQKDFEEIGAEPLVNYIRALKKVLEEQAKKFKDSGQIIAQIELSNVISPEVSISFDGKISQELMQGFYDEAVKLPLKARTKTLRFQVLFSVKG